MRRLLHLAVISLFTLGASAAPVTPQRTAAPVRPQRIVSLNLCTDQLLLALADRSQIAALTRNARDAEMSAAAAQAQGITLLKESAEQLYALHPDLILGMPASRHPMLRPLGPEKYRTLDLGYAESYPTIIEQIRTVAAAVGHPARGEALIRRMEADLAKIGKLRGGKVAAYYQRRGFMTGTETLIDDLMTRTGLINLAAKLGKPPLSQVSLEEMVAARPDFLIVESATDRITDQGTEMLHHPALRSIPRISIPQAWTVCGSPAYVLAARGIVEQAARRRH
ncbi:ABC transporter substrate-binding protein [Sphingomonas sp.]|uniref:ABC transporter substrate-binding protein n=1 Tax=Sphingomonas sp. TaxID=28214 RepID=UPI002ED9D5AB